MNYVIIVLLTVCLIVSILSLVGSYIRFFELKEQVEELRAELSEQKEKILIIQMTILGKGKRKENGKIL